MSIKSSGLPLGFNEINAEYGYGTNLNSYRGQAHWSVSDKTNTQYFPNNPISFNNFYSTSTGGSGYVVDITSSQRWYVPYNGTAAVLIVAGGCY